MFRAGSGKAGILAAVLLLSFEMLYFNCTSNIAGTSEVGNPSVSATITDKNGKPLKNIPVVLLPESFNIVKEKDIGNFTQNITDEYGHVDLLMKGSDSIYNITSTDSVYKYQLLKKISKNDTLLSITNSYSLGSIALQEPGIIQITIDSNSFLKGSAITIPGTTISYTVNSPGIYQVKSPAGVLNINYCSTVPVTKIPVEKNISAINVTSNDTIKITTRSIVTQKNYDTTHAYDTIVRNIDTIISFDTVRICDSIHNIDSTIINDTVITHDTITVSDTLRTIHGISQASKDTVFLADTVIRTDTVYTIDSISIITTKTCYSKVLDLVGTKYTDTLQIEMRHLFRTLFNINKKLRIGDSIFTPGYTLITKNTDTILSITYFDTMHIISNYQIYDTVTAADTIRYTDTLIHVKSDNVFDTSRYSHKSLNKDTLLSVNTAMYPLEIFVNKDSTVLIDTIIKTVFSFDYDTTIYLDTQSVVTDTVKRMRPFAIRDSIWVPVTYYDFHSDYSNPEFGINYESGEKYDMVSMELDTFLLPSSGTESFMNQYIKYWFTSFDSPYGGKNDFYIPVYNTTIGSDYGTLLTFKKCNHDTSFKNIVIRDSLLFLKSSNYDTTYRFAAKDFYPIDNRGFGKEGLDHNYSFTMAFTLELPSQENENTIAVTASDETWVFANGKKIIDIGGVHKAAISRNASLGASTPYTVRIFHTVRNLTESSFDFSFDLH